MPSRSPRASAALTAYVLHRYDWSESSLILDVFTREQGRIAVAAKGAKRPYSQLRAVLLPFQRISLGLGRAPSDESESEVHNLRAAEWAGGPPMLSGAALFSGFYLNELLMRLLPRDDPHERLFDAYAESLRCLAEARDQEPVLRGNAGSLRTHRTTARADRRAARGASAARSGRSRTSARARRALDACPPNPPSGACPGRPIRSTKGRAGETRAACRESPSAAGAHRARAAPACRGAA